MAKKFPLNPAHPERICWGCDRYCPAVHMVCGNGSVATPHPAELFGEDWLTWTTADEVGSRIASSPSPSSGLADPTVAENDKQTAGPIR